MITHLGLGACAGLVSALLFSVVAAGSPPGVLLLYLAPLPILIVALGWHHLLGLLALSVGALAVSWFLRPAAGVAFALGPALSAWALAYLALMLRGRSGPDGRGPDWLPVGVLLLAASLAGGLVALVSAIAMGDGEHDSYTARLSRLVSSFIRFQAGIGREAPLPDLAGLPGSALVQALVAVAPAGIAGLLTLILSANLAGAAKVVSVSGRLPRPWPRLAALRMPPAALGIAAVGCVLSFLPGFTGVAGVALLGGMVVAFALQGLAFLHDVSRGRPGRGALLTLAYLLTVFFAQVFLPLLALAGMADTATPVRQRLLSRRAPPPGGPLPRP